MTKEQAKKLVGEQGAQLVEEGMAVGLGTGTTATQFIRALATRNASTELHIRCVASSDASAHFARSLGLNVLTLNELPRLDLYIDGADEVDSNLDLIKGGGGSHLREKILASSSDQFVVLVDSSKMVSTLGKFPLPVEVVKMAYVAVRLRLETLGLNPVLRLATGTAEPLLTDEGNDILDCHCGPIDAPSEIAGEIRSVAGVVEHGLFLNMVSMCLVAGDEGSVALNRSFVPTKNHKSDNSSFSTKPAELKETNEPN
jgi:ribose 5-phosphate isomerase A